MFSLSLPMLAHTIVFLKIFLYVCMYFFIYCHRMACRILVPRPGIKPVPSAVKAQSLTTGQPGNSLLSIFKNWELSHKNQNTFFLFFFFINLFILFIYFWLHWVFVAVRRLSLVAVSGDYSLLRCVGFSLWWLLLLWSMGSRRAGFSSCGMRAQ